MPSKEHLMPVDKAALNDAVASGRAGIATQAQGCAHILRGLISYHERMTMGRVPECDPYLSALRFALSCVEEKIQK